MTVNRNKLHCRERMYRTYALSSTGSVDITIYTLPWGYSKILAFQL